MDLRKRERPFPNGLELFLLLAIDEATDSLYELQRHYRLNSGAITHALYRLESKGALVKESAGYRRKRKLTVTSEGRALLNENWKSASDEPFEDIQNLARAALVTMIKLGIRRPQEGAELLRSKADGIQRSARNPAQLELRPGGDLPGKPKVYAWIKEKAEYHQAQAMAATLREVADLVAQLRDD